MSIKPFPANNYPTGIFQQNTPDETQRLLKGPEFTTLVKGWRTRSEIYERIFPDKETAVLRIDGPRRGGCFMTFHNNGGVRLRSGPIDTEVAGSGIIGVHSEGGKYEKHLSCSYYEYNTGPTEHEGVALSIAAYGDVVEETIGGTRYIKATKIAIIATDQLDIEGQNIKIQAQGELQMAASSILTATYNEKDIVTGQKMSFGAGEETFMQFDPRAQVNIISPGSINMKAAQDFKLGTLGCISLFAVGGPGALIKNRTVGMSLSTKTQFAAGGTAATDVVSTGFTTIKGTGGVEVTTPAMLDMNGTGSAMITSEGVMDVSAATLNLDGTAAVKITGAMIFLN